MVTLPEAGSVNRTSARPSAFVTVDVWESLPPDVDQFTTTPGTARPPSATLTTRGAGSWLFGGPLCSSPETLEMLSAMSWIVTVATAGEIGVRINLNEVSFVVPEQLPMRLR